jgi:aminopeptidase N
MRRIATSLLAFLIAAGTAAAEGQARPSTRIVAGESNDEVVRVPARLIEAHGGGGALRTLPTACPDSFDVVHYDLRVSVDHTAGTLAGDVFVTIVSLKNGLASARLDLKSLTVSSVLQNGGPIAYAHAGDELVVTFAAPLAALDTAIVEIVYGGAPWNEGGGGFGGFWIYTYPVTDFSMGVGLYTDPPSMGRMWFPGVDQPCDKATSDIVIETPLAKMGVANGALDSVVVDSIAGTNTWYWREAHPIATYLMAMSVAKYDAIPDDDDPRIVYYVHRTHTPLAAGTFQNVDLMMDAFEDLFGPYPYTGEKFSFVTTPLGDMEHQTAVFHSYALMSGDTTYDDILAHELSHQWFGDCVTYGDWRDVWLSEGFATYCEALWHEWRYGTADYRDYVTHALMLPYLAASENLTYPIYDPDALWGTISYEKGGTILHMLRRVVGDPLFFASMNAFLDDHEYADATTPDFVASCEATCGQDLDWFFDEWIYQGGHPIIDWGWRAETLGPGAYRVTIETMQTQVVGPVYTMPVDFAIGTAAGDTLVTAWLDQASNAFTFDLASEPTGIVFDPDDWLLDEANQVETAVEDGLPPLRFALEAPAPNPFNPSTTIRFTLPERREARVRIYSLEGRLLRTIFAGELPAGGHEVRWDGSDEGGRPLASGVYFCRLASGANVETRKLLLLR